jgi:hypothetical protein
METNTIIVNGLEIIEYNNSSIFVVKKFLNKDFCNKIIKFMDESPYSRPGMTYNNVECFIVNYEEYNDITKTIDAQILNIFEIFSKFLNIDIVGSTTLELRKVFGETFLHKDGACTDIVNHPFNNTVLKSVRILTLVGALNDDYGGGVYNFPKQKVNIKLEAGSIILFPPYWTHYHEVSKININPTGLKYRYIFSCWGMDNFLVTTEKDENINNIILIK